MKIKRCKGCNKKLKNLAKYRCLKCHLKYMKTVMTTNNVVKKKEVRKKLSSKMQNESGVKNRNWKGGITNIKGYIHIYSPNHPNCDNKNYYPLHRIMMEKKLKRFLKTEETVHHKDENKLNNSLSNLKLFINRGAHQKYHRKLK